jgi:hypothetical protein
MKLYRIADWHRHFETYETKKLDSLKWVAVPNKHDGLGFRSICAERDSIALYGAWVLILQLASKSPKDRRGMLIRGENPITARGMSMMTGFPEKVFERALEFFSKPIIGWIVTEEWNAPMLDAAVKTAAHAGKTACMEGNGMEGIEGKGSKAAADAALVFPQILQTPDFEQAWADWLKHRSEIRKPMKPTQCKAVLGDLAAMGVTRAIAAIRHTITKGWQGLREPEGNEVKRYTPQAAMRQSFVEPIGWKKWIDENMPDAVFRTGGTHEAKRWADLPAYAQEAILKEMQKHG